MKITIPRFGPRPHSGTRPEKRSRNEPMLRPPARTPSALASRPRSDSPEPPETPEAPEPPEAPVLSPASADVALRTRVARATGKAGTYRLDAARLLPGPKPRRRSEGTSGGVVQVTDGHQAVCALVPGHVTEPVLIPAGVLPTRRTRGGVRVARDGDGWRSSDGKAAAPCDPDDRFPSIGDVLPEVGKAKPTPITLGIDLARLTRVADALGTTQLTLLITPPTHGGHVNQPVAVCPALPDDGVDGAGVVMPITPQHDARYYARVRRDVIKAETRCSAKRTRRRTPASTRA